MTIVAKFPLPASETPLAPSSFLANVTPVILTYNEAPNIGRVLERLDWANDIVVVDSGSTDATQDICAAYPQVRFIVRAFDSHAGQWSYAVHETAITTDWVLALDADYILTSEATAEIAAIPLTTTNLGFWISFRYAILGTVLKSGIYPPVLALFRRDKVCFEQDGHTQRAVIGGPTGKLAARLIHDDRKSLDRWLMSQIAYARLEAAKPEEEAVTGLRAWLRRRTPFAPLLVGVYILLLRGALFEGPPGWLYALQRILAEALLGCARLNRSLRP